MPGVGRGEGLLGGRRGRFGGGGLALEDRRPALALVRDVDRDRGQVWSTITGQSGRFESKPVAPGLYMALSAGRVSPVIIRDGRRSGIIWADQPGYDADTETWSPARRKFGQTFTAFAPWFAGFTFWNPSQAVPMAAETPGWTVRLTVDLGKDVGQNFGSLFEAASPDGNSAAGAGFLGAYNSYYRANRHTLHFYVKPPRGCNTVQVTSFPRPSGSCHHYVFDVGGVVYATDRSGKTPVLRWDEGAGIWTATDPPQPPGFLVGSHRLECYPNRVTVDGRDAFRFDSAHGAAGLYYLSLIHISEPTRPY